MPNEFLEEHFSGEGIEQTNCGIHHLLLRNLIEFFEFLFKEVVGEDFDETRGKRIGFIRNSFLILESIGNFSH